MEPHPRAISLCTDSFLCWEIERLPRGGPLDPFSLVPLNLSPRLRVFWNGSLFPLQPLQPALPLTVCFNRNLSDSLFEPFHTLRVPQFPQRGCGFWTHPLHLEISLVDTLILCRSQILPSDGEASTTPAPRTTNSKEGVAPLLAFPSSFLYTTKGTRVPFPPLWLPVAFYVPPTFSSGIVVSKFHPPHPLGQTLGLCFFMGQTRGACSDFGPRLPPVFRAPFPYLFVFVIWGH